MSLLGLDTCEGIALTVAEQVAWEHYVEFYGASIAAVNNWSELGPITKKRMLDEAALSRQRIQQSNGGS